MNARWKPLPGQHKAMMAEVRREKKKWAEEVEKSVDVAVLYSLHEMCGLGAKRLKDFFDGLNKIYDELIEFYDMKEEQTWVYEKKLKEIGVDIDAWRAEVEEQELQARRDDKRRG